MCTQLKREVLVALERRDAIERLAKQLHETMDAIEASTPEPIPWSDLDPWEQNYCRKCVAVILQDVDFVLLAINRR